MPSLLPFEQSPFPLVLSISLLLYFTCRSYSYPKFYYLFMLIIYLSCQRESPWKQDPYLSGLCSILKAKSKQHQRNSVESSVCGKCSNIVYEFKTVPWVLFYQEFYPTETERFRNFADWRDEVSCISKITCGTTTMDYALQSLWRFVWLC